MSAVVSAAALAAGCVLLLRVLSRRLEAPLTALTLGLTLLGTFAFDLLIQGPALSAAAGFALAALALFVREPPGPLSTPRALVIGAAAGVAAVWHPPNLALALLALPRRGETTRPLAAALVATAGTWAVAQAMGLAAPLPTGPWEPLLSLFGSRQGLLHLTPALWLGGLGLALQLRSDPRAAAPPAAAALALVVLHAACPLTPAACPREQVAAVLPLLALPAGLALRALREAVRRAPAAPLWGAGALLGCWNLLFMQQYATDMIPRDFPVAFAVVARNQAALVARTVGAPLSWPANWLFAARYDTGPDRFDAAAGKRLARGSRSGATVDVGELATDDALLLEGWSVRHPCGNGVCRAVESRARVLLPVAIDGHGSFTVRAAGEGWLSVSAADSERNAAAALGPRLADLCFALDPAPPGLRAFTLAVSPTGRGTAPRALVDHLTLSPEPCP